MPNIRRPVTDCSSYPVDFHALACRLAQDRRTARETWSARQVAYELLGYLKRVEAFGPGERVTRDVANGLDLRRELVAACAARQDTPEPQATALRGIQTLLEDAQLALLSTKNMCGPRVAESLTVLAQEIDLSSDQFE